MSIAGGWVPKIMKNDCRSLTSVKTSSVDFVCGQPPYWNAVRYTAAEPGDLSRITDPNKFYTEMSLVASEIKRVLKTGKRCAVLIGDVRRHGILVPVGFNVMSVFLHAGLELQEIIIKVQHNDRSSRFYATKNSKVKFRLAHEYLLVFKKTRKRLRSSIRRSSKT